MAIINDNPSSDNSISQLSPESQEEDAKFSYADDSTAEKDAENISASDVRSLREVAEAHGGKRVSINDFTSEDIRKSEKWARKFYRELGTKSPFFRAWFGDWRAYDTNPVDVIDIPTIDIDDAILEYGNYHIEDTGWDVYAGKVLNDDTRHHSGGNHVNIKALTAIDSILKNSVLLDTVVSEPNTNKKSSNTAFLHKLYSMVKYDGKNYVAKVTVEEFYNEGTDTVDRRAYNLKAIKIEPAGGQLGINSNPSVPVADPIISIADLYSLVNTYDKEFSPKPVNPLMLNEDGTPKVFYHGTNADFTVFDESKIGSRTGNPRKMRKQLTFTETQPEKSKRGTLPHG